MAESKAAKARVEYRRELQRINRQLNRLAKEGRAVPASALPKPVKRPTEKSVERLKNVKGRELRARSKPIEEITGAVPAATTYKLPPTEKQLQRARKAKKTAPTTRAKKPKRARPTKPQVAPAPPEPQVPQFEETEEVDYPTRAQLVYARLRDAIGTIKVPLFKTELLNALNALTDSELLSKWDSTVDKDRKALEEFADYVNNFLDSQRQKGYDFDDAVAITIDRCYARFDLIYYILTDTRVSADIAAAANDIIMGV